MDGSRFDNLTRSLAISRRGILKQLAAGFLAGVSGLGSAALAGAQGCLGLREWCGADAECCDGFCDPASGRCACPAGTDACDGTCFGPGWFQDDPENCGRCRNRCRRAPECNMSVCIAGACGEAPDPFLFGRPCGPLGDVYGVCTADGACVCPPEFPTLCGNKCIETLSDPRNCGACGYRCPRVSGRAPTCTNGVCGIACRPGYFECGGDCCLDSRNCCNGICCGSAECCHDGVCSVESCAPHCLIDGQWIADGATNPNNPCELCDRDRNETAWSTSVSGTPCGEPGQCCNLGLCQDCGCLINGNPVASGALNPGNDCEVCDPVQDSTGWSPLTGDECGDRQTCCEGVCCAPEQCCNEHFTCETCRCFIDDLRWQPGNTNFRNDCQVCDPEQNPLEWSLHPDWYDCGSVAGRICCNGDCCSPTECCTSTGCEECGEICRIDRRDVPALEPSPDDPCQICDPERRREGWSEAPDGFVCGDDLDDERVCCNGLCCEPGECCDEVCKPCRCRIGGFPWDADARNPLNHCQVCDPERNQEEWSPANNGAGCGAGDERECCEGQCCPEGQCCNEIGECEPCPCQINGQNWVADARNPSNTCLVCDPDTSRDAWTPLTDQEACGNDDDDRVCCSGACCPQGQCCEAGACVDCGCLIDNDPVVPGTVNLDNSCQICDPTRARLTWSPVDNGIACGSEDGQRCCGGECCESDECCVLDACGTCLCQIDGDNVAAGTVNIDDPCEVCDPNNDPFGWSTVADGAECGEDQVCCAGACCDPGLCCNLGICQVCGCLIGEEQVAEFTVNPDNVCQWCDPVLDPLGWSPRSDEPCGDGGAQVCCNGACCGVGYCCDLNNACAPCPCEIDGATFAHGASNPLNKCELCDSLTDRYVWSNAPDNATCGLTDDRYCCAGSCCPGGECCHALDGACGAEPCHCSIGEEEIAEGKINPANECERCDPREDPSGWSPLPDDSACGETGTQVCCLGTCCSDGQCCNLGVCGFCGCLINNQSYESGDENPANVCQTCDPLLDPFSWSPVVDETSCGIVQVCCGGECCGANECCGAGGDCEECAIVCRIGGAAYAPGAGNPFNACEVCDPSESTTEWTPVTNGTICGEFEDQVCCEGVCCVRGGCCIEQQCMIDGCPDPCEEDPDQCRCRIDLVEYADGELNPGNPCEQCRYWEHPGRWSAADDHSPCGSGGQQYCCQGACCAAGECCTADGSCLSGGSAVCEGCDIDGRFYPITALKPDNPCLWCAPFYSATEWTKRDNHATCGPGGMQNCCDGICCTAGLCCTGTSAGGTCEPCGCEIDGGSYVPGQLNPANWCQHCDPALSTTSWSVSEVQFCSFDYSRDCCNGICCLPGTCCGFSGVCETTNNDYSNCVNWQV